MSLRRFAAGRERYERERAAAQGPVPPNVPPGERCEMCAEPIGDEHGHVANLEDRRILCTCRPCTLLFTHSGAGSERRDDGDSPIRRFRAVPERYRYDPDFAMSSGDWDELAIPVRMAFFFRNSGMGRTVAFYPSPGGATESELTLDAWVRVLAANPAVADVEADVEALLVDRGSGAYLVPIDVCYELVGLVRLHWKGFDGGEEAWTAIEAFFATLRDRSQRVTREDARG
ncbi:MAG: DUF5947 family protein [Actinoallomurus sp.]